MKNDINVESSGEWRYEKIKGKLWFEVVERSS